MSKPKMSTREKIRDKALEMFNERGIEYVGLRELAATLDIRVGNITYYFPTKDDLVYELSQDLARKNSAIIVPAEKLTLLGFLETMHLVFLNHVAFRCLLLSFVHIMAQNKMVHAAYKKTQSLRTTTIKTNLVTLVDTGYLKVANAQDLDYLVASLSLINRFWISEAAVAFPETDPAQQIHHYLKLIAKLILPFATAKGKKEISKFEAGLNSKKVE